MLRSRQQHDWKSVDCVKLVQGCGVQTRQTNIPSTMHAHTLTNNKRFAIALLLNDKIRDKLALKCWFFPLGNRVFPFYLTSLVFFFNLTFYFIFLSKIVRVAF